MGQARWGAEQVGHRAQLREEKIWARDEIGGIDPVSGSPTTICGHLGWQGSLQKNETEGAVPSLWLTFGPSLAFQQVEHLAPPGWKEVSPIFCPSRGSMLFASEEIRRLGKRTSIHSTELRCYWLCAKQFSQQVFSSTSGGKTVPFQSTDDVLNAAQPQTSQHLCMH